MILHIVDAAAVDGRNPIDDFNKINVELKKYSEKLSARPQILVANKIDLPQAKENLPALEELAEREGIKFFAISAATHENLDALINYVGSRLEEIVPELLGKNDELYGLSDELLNGIQNQPLYLNGLHSILLVKTVSYVESAYKPTNTSESASNLLSIAAVKALI